MAGMSPSRKKSDFPAARDAGGDLRADAAAPIPPGFRPVTMGGQFMAINGPLYARWTGSQVLMGFRVEARHCNPLDNCHGGMLASFADMLLPVVTIYQKRGTERRFLPTINLQIDYLGAAPLGSWVQGEGQLLRETRNLAFVQGLVTADGEPALRVSGIFKQGPVFGGQGNDPFGLMAPNATHEAGR